MFIRKNTSRWLLYIITDSTTGLRKTGLTYSDVTCKYKKEGETAETVYTLDATNFREIGNGKYEIQFTSSELNTIGAFNTEITGAGINPVTREDYVIDFVRGRESLWENLV